MVPGPRVPGDTPPFTWRGTSTTSMLSLLAMAGKVFLVVFLEQRGSAQQHGACAESKIFLFLFLNHFHTVPMNSAK